MIPKFLIWFFVFGAFLSAPYPAPVRAGGTDGYLKVDGPCDLTFPEDHGPHPGYKTEWWYYTGNLTSAEGRRFGFQLTFFRSQMKPNEEYDIERPETASPWRTNQLTLAHFALTDISNGIHFSAEDMARQALNIAGAEQDGSATRVFLKNWRMELTPGQHLLKAESENFSVDLTLTPLKRPVLHGNEGYSMKGSRPENASCYYSFTRLEASGVIFSGGQASPVRGLAWMDHEFSTAPLEEGLEGWDWFGLQLEDGTELMVFFLRKKAGGLSEASSGTFVDKSGQTVRLGLNDFEIVALDYWKSDESGAVYPSSWKLKVHSLGLELKVDSNLPDQEMQTPESTGVTYWEGSVSVDGEVRGKRVRGYGYAELTGYAGDFDAPM